MPSVEPKIVTLEKGKKENIVKKRKRWKMVKEGVCALRLGILTLGVGVGVVWSFIPILLRRRFDYLARSRCFSFP